MEIGSKTAEKNSAQTNRQTNRHYENNGHLAANQCARSHYARCFAHTPRDKQLRELTENVARRRPNARTANRHLWATWPSASGDRKCGSEAGSGRRCSTRAPACHAATRRAELAPSSLHPQLSTDRYQWRVCRGSEKNSNWKIIKFTFKSHVHCTDMRQRRGGPHSTSLSMSWHSLKVP